MDECIQAHKTPPRTRFALRLVMDENPKSDGQDGARYVTLPIGHADLGLADGCGLLRMFERWRSS